MVKRFFCARCHAEDPHAGYDMRATAFVDDDGNMEYYCPLCYRGISVVDKPCEHEWSLPRRRSGAYLDRHGWTRTCTKCGLEHWGTAVLEWPDA